MPSGADAKDSTLFAPLTYYKLTVPVAPLPRALNREAIRLSAKFLEQVTPRRERFLALAYKPSYGTVQWITQASAPNYWRRPLGVFDGVEVVEFVPRIEMPSSR